MLLGFWGERIIGFCGAMHVLIELNRYLLLFVRSLDNSVSACIEFLLSRRINRRLLPLLYLLTPEMTTHFDSELSALFRCDTLFSLWNAYSCEKVDTPIHTSSAILRRRREQANFAIV